MYLNNFTHATRFVYSSIVPGHLKGENVSHPIHMHGHSYFVAKIGYPEYYPYGTIKASNKDLHEPNCGPPSWKDGTARGICVSRTTVRTDAVIILAGGYVVVHFIQDDPGWWFLNSHIDYHLNNGMAIEVSENSNRASSPSEPLLTDTKNVCFTIQRLDKKLPLAVL